MAFQVKLFATLETLPVGRACPFDRFSDPVQISSNVERTFDGK